MEVTLQIPTKSYIKKYIAVMYGDNFKLSHTTAFGIIVLNILKRKTYKNPNYDYKKLKQNFDASITCRAHLDKAYRYGIVLLEPQKYHLFRAVDEMMKYELVKQALINQSNYGIDFKTSILNILEAYDITEDELDYQSIRKYFNRNYKKFQNRMII